MITKKAVLGAVNGFVGGDKNAEVYDAIKATPAAKIRELAQECVEDGESPHPENVVYKIAAANGIYW